MIIGEDAEKDLHMVFGRLGNQTHRISSMVSFPVLGGLNIDEIVKCKRCNLGCCGRLGQLLPSRYVVNPNVGGRSMPEYYRPPMKLKVKER